MNYQIKETTTLLGLGWKDTLNELFNSSVPEQHRWENYEDILNVLQRITTIPNFQKLFYPLGGALEIDRVNAAQEQGCVEFFSKVYSNFYDVIKPKELQFEAFIEAPQWNYFRIEAEVLPQSSVNPNRSYHSEQLAVLPTGEYINITHSETGEYNGQPLVQPVKKVIRHLEGSFLICPQTSPYNQNSPLYDGRHRTMSRDELRADILEKIAQSKISK